MDLQEWIARDHAAVKSRFDSAIGQHVPHLYWKEAGPGGGSSIAWLLFHMTYHQDLALNTAITNQPPLLAQHRAALGLGNLTPAAGLSESEDLDVTDALDLHALVGYMDAVNGDSAAWIDRISLLALDSIPESSVRLRDKAGLAPEGDLSWLHSMWNGKPVSWFVQWECIGHGHAHVGEMVGIRNRLGLSPF